MTLGILTSRVESLSKNESPNSVLHYYDGHRSTGNSITGLTFAGGELYMFACAKLPLRTFASGSFTYVQFPVRIAGLYFPVKQKCQWGFEELLLGSTMLLQGKIAMRSKEGLPGLSLGVL